MQGQVFSTSSAELKLYTFGIYSTVFVSSKPTGISSHQAFIMLKQSFKMDYFESLQGRAPPSLLASCGLVPFVRSCRGWKYLASHCTLLRKMFNILVQNTIRELFTMVSITISVQNCQKNQGSYNRDNKIARKTKIYSTLDLENFCGNMWFVLADTMLLV